MKIYLVGGAIRDEILHLPVKERDWVVVGATPEDLLALNFQPVGKAFPVFLHPKTKEEYALARTERKIGAGYYGFECYASPDITLEEDLKRRDLTINAMARDPTGEIIDPYGGQKDIQDRVLRHVSPAFVEDPLRVLRVARFAARYASLGFRVASDTLQLMQTMADSGEIDHLVGDRIWQELDRALGESHPEVFIEVLVQSRAWSILFPELALKGEALQAFNEVVKRSTSHSVRFASLMLQLLQDRMGLESLCKRYPVPRAYKDLASLVISYYQHYQDCLALNPKKLIQLFAKADAYRRMQRFKDFLLVCETHALNDTKLKSAVKSSRFFLALLECVKQVEVQPLLQAGIRNGALREALDAKRLEKLQQFLAHCSQVNEPD